jgi:hypothetical protein
VAKVLSQTEKLKNFRPYWPAMGKNYIPIIQKDTRRLPDKEEGKIP